MSDTKAFVMPLVPKQGDLVKEGNSLIARANKLAITDEDGFVASWSMVEAHDRAINRVEEVFEPFVSGLHRLHKMAVQLRDGFVTPLAASKRRLLDQRGNYTFRQEQLKKIEDDKKAEAIRLAQQKELEKEAKKVEKTGDVEAAAVLREEAKTLPIPVIAPTPAVPKTTGSVIRTRWCFEITDPDQVQREYCCPDEKAIRKIVDAMGDKAPIKGLKIWKEVKEHSRSAS